MSSTIALHQGPSSLPSDYAILSRLNKYNESGTPESQSDNSTVQITRRKSFPASVSHCYRPLNPTIGVHPCVDSAEPHSEASQHLTPSPTETSPLLDRPPVPQIEENIDYNVSDKTSTVNMFWEELAVLTKYAIPVFGYAPSFIFHELTHPIFFTALNFFSNLSS